MKSGQESPMGKMSIQLWRIILRGSFWNGLIRLSKLTVYLLKPLFVSLQTEEVLSKDSTEELNAGLHPGPMTEINFWKEKCQNLESLFDQMQQEATQHMASILKSTDSAYYPSFQNMMAKVVAALSEALDVTLYLEPLIEHFNVSNYYLGFNL